MMPIALDPTVKQQKQQKPLLVVQVALQPVELEEARPKRQVVKAEVLKLLQQLH